MKELAPELHKSLENSSLVIFKVRNARVLTLSKAQHKHIARATSSKLGVECSEDFLSNPTTTLTTASASEHPLAIVMGLNGH